MRDSTRAEGNITRPRRGVLPASLAAASLVIGAAALLQGSDQPRGHGYRGPETNGIYPARGLLRTWPPGGPPLLWRANPETGACPVSVVGDRVYAVGGRNAKLRAFSLDGEPVGQATLGSAGWKRFGFSRSTPLIAEGMAVGTTPNADIFGVDLAKMETRWKVSAWKSFGSGNGGMGWGLPESPILHGPLVIFNAVSRDDETPPLVAIDIRDGYKVWGMDAGKGKAYSAADVSAALFHHRGRSLVACPTFCYVVCLDADNGKVLWEIPSCGSKNLTPVYSDGLLLVSVNRQLPAGSKAPPAVWPCAPDERPAQPATASSKPAKLTPREQMGQQKWGGEEMVMLRLGDDGADCRVLWVRQDCPPRYSHAVILRGRVYCFGNSDRDVERSKDGSLPSKQDARRKGTGRVVELLCLDAQTGALLAKAPAGTPGHVVAAEGMIYAVDLVRLPDPKDPEGAGRNSPRLRLFRPTPEGFELAGEFHPFSYADTPTTGDVEWQASVPPVIAKGRLFFRYGQLLVYNIAAEPPSFGWRGDGSGLAADARPPIRWGRRINLRWQAALPAGGASAPAVGKDRVYAACADGVLAALDGGSGKLLWTRRLGKAGAGGGETEPTPVAREGLVFAASADGAVACFDGDGAERWRHSVATGPSPTASPLLSEDVLVVQAGALVGLGAGDGKQRWRAKVPAGRWATPVKARLDGINVVLTAWGNLLRAADGEIVAEGIPTTGGLSPVVDDRIAYCCSSGPPGRVSAVRLPAGAEKKGKAEVVWTSELKGLEAATSPLASGGLLYVLGRKGTLVALDAADGKEVYRHALISAGAGDASRATLAGAGGRVYVEGIGSDHRSVVLAGGRDFTMQWSYAARDGAPISAFRGDRQYVRAGARCFATMGHTPAEPQAPDIVDLSEAPKVDIPGGVPVARLADDVMPDKWLFAGPIPRRSLEEDFLAALGGRRRAIPTPGTTFPCGKAKFGFAELGADKFWTDRNYSGNRRTINLTAAHARKWQSTGYYFTVLDNDRPRYVSLALLLPGANPWRARLDTAIWLGGHPVAEKQVIRLGPGRWPLMIQAVMGECESWGRIFMLPRFLDVTARAEKQLKTHAAAAAEWRAYQAEPKSFVLGPARP